MIFFSPWHPQLLEVCKSDRTCGRGLYCDYHYGNCVQHKLELEPCRRDGHCDRGLECRFGTCQKVLKLGMEGELILQQIILKILENCPLPANDVSTLTLVIILHWVLFLPNIKGSRTCSQKTDRNVHSRRLKNVSQIWWQDKRNITTVLFELLHLL